MKKSKTFNAFWNYTSFLLDFYKFSKTAGNCFYMDLAFE